LSASVGALPSHDAHRQRRNEGTEERTVLESEYVTGGGFSGKIPAGLDPWLVEFIADAERETAFLRDNGAESQAKARESLIRNLISRATDHLDREISVEEAAQLLGRSPETVRRAVRRGRLPDLRENPNGHHRFRRGDVIALNARRNGEYDPIADAQDIAKLRRGAA